MSNLLTENKKIELRKNYRLRIIFVGLRFLVISLFILSIILGSFTFILRTEIRNTQRDADNIGEMSELITYSDALRDTNKKLNILKIPVDTNGPTEVMLDILDRMVSGITINLFEYNESEGSSKTVSISGNAMLRGDLIAFLESLRAHPQVDMVESPISNLAASSNINFTIVLEFSEEINN